MQMSRRVTLSRQRRRWSSIGFCRLPMCQIKSDQVHSIIIKRRTTADSKLSFPSFAWNESINGGGKANVIAENRFILQRKARHFRADQETMGRYPHPLSSAFYGRRKSPVGPFRYGRRKSWWNDTKWFFLDLGTRRAQVKVEVDHLCEWPDGEWKFERVDHLHQIIRTV